MDNPLQLFIYVVILSYSIFDIFMITFYGNEIKLASDRLSYCLYESNWCDRSQSIKKDVLIFGEFLMQPRQLIVLKLYPLSLGMFTKVDFVLSVCKMTFDELSLRVNFRF